MEAYTDFADVYDILEYMENTLISYMKENIVIDSIKDDKDEIFLHISKMDFITIIYSINK